MAEILEARVIQKVGTEAEWLQNTLPLLNGEAAIVRTGDGTPVNLKFGDGGKTFAELPYFIDYSQAAYIAYEVTPTQDVAYTFVGEGTYGAITVAEGYMAVLGWDGTNWSKNAEVEMPQTDLEKAKINKGKAYPYVNQPLSPSANLIKLNKIILDAQVDEVIHSTTYEYTVTLISRNYTTSDWGNAIHIRVLNKSDLSTFTSVAFKSTDATLDADTLQQLNKIDNGGLQTISLRSASLNKTFHVTIDSDELVDGDLVDAQYTDTSNKMYFAGSVYNKVPVLSADNLALKTELTPITTWQAQADKYGVNKGKNYPMVNYPTSPTLASKVTTLKNTLLDIEVFTDIHGTWDYYIGGFYKNHSGFGNGFILMRRRRSDNAVGGLYITSLASGASNIDSNSVANLNKWTLGGVQYTEIVITNTSFGVAKINIVVDLDSMPTGYTQLGYQDNVNWQGNDFHPSVYKTSASTPAPVEQIKTFDTFRSALVSGQTGMIKVGSLLAESIVPTVSFSGGTTAYYPSQIWKQYRSLNKNASSPKRMSEILTIQNEDGSNAFIKSFGSRYTYFGTTSVIYRTQQELSNKVVTHLNTQYEKLILPDPMPDSYRTTVNSIMGVYEMDNGELIIEVRNGIKENEADDYRGNRTQIYVTNGFKSLTGTMNLNNVLEYDLTGIVSRVHQYKAFTQTYGKTGTTVSIVGNKIAMAPYYTGLVGLIHYSNDYGNTWKVIFNMGVMGSEFAVPYKGSQGAWPLPENLNPAMPSDMWTAGGNTNFHVHGVTIDPYMDGRIWVSTGDSGTNALGRTALWYTDDEGQTWTRIQTKGTGVLDGGNGLQPMGVVCTKDYVLAGSDSPPNGLYRWGRTKKSSLPALEAAWWHEDVYTNVLKVIYGGGVVTREGYVYSMFFPNTPTDYSKGLVVYTADGVSFEEVYFDELSNGTSSGTRLIDWGGFIGQDRFGNVFVANNGGSIPQVVKLF